MDRRFQKKIRKREIHVHLEYQEQLCYDGEYRDMAHNDGHI